MTLADLPSKHSRAGFNQTLNFIFTDEDAFASFLDASDHRTELHMALAKFTLRLKFPVVKGISFSKPIILNGIHSLFYGSL
jgi:hypothetical protein